MHLPFVIVLVCIDQISKLLFNLLIKKNIVINSIFTIKITHNHGLCLGFLQGPWAEKYSVLIRLIALLCFFIFFSFYQHKKFITPKILIVSGGICNLLDGIVYGYVIDLIAISIRVPYIESIFYCCINIADIYATIGTSIFLYRHCTP